MSEIIEVVHATFPDLHILNLVKIDRFTPGAQDVYAIDMGSYLRFFKRTQNFNSYTDDCLSSQDVEFADPLLFDKIAAILGVE